MPTPVGPASRDPDDPDFWDWDDPAPDARPASRLRYVVAVVALLVIVALVLVSVL